MKRKVEREGKGKEENIMEEDKEERKETKKVTH